jgi:hypothetical protein
VKKKEVLDPLALQESILKAAEVLDTAAVPRTKDGGFFVLTPPIRFGRITGVDLYVSNMLDPKKRKKK